MKKSFLFIIALAFSCSSKKDVVYLQDTNNNDIFTLEYNDYKLDVDDILKIDILDQNLEITGLFNKNTTLSNNLNSESVIYSGYQINTEGFINFPEIGEIYAKDLSLIELKNKLRNLLIDNDLLKNPIIDIKIVNSSFVALGEFNKPGRYSYVENNLNLLEAIAMAGDLTINGKRNNIKIIRKKNNTNEFNVIDITSADFINSEYFQVFPDDIILVSPNSTRVKNAGIIGNSGTLLSLLSFLLSSIIVINSQ